MNTTILLNEIPEGYYQELDELIYTLSPDKIYMVKQFAFSANDVSSYAKYFFRLPTKDRTYEALITKELYEGICRDIHFEDHEVKLYVIYEYLFGKDTVRVVVETEVGKDKHIIYAVGPVENKDWQIEFQKYHISK